jgi:hypothetical protein
MQKKGMKGVLSRQPEYPTAVWAMAVVGSDGDGPRFVESRIHLAWSEGGSVLVMKSVPIVVER